MSKDKISIQDLVDSVSKQTGFSKKKTEDFLRVFQSTLEEAIVSDGIVKIKGFGTFKLVWNADRKSVNVQTKQEYIIPGHYKVSFVPDATIKEIINEPIAGKAVGKKEFNPLDKLNEQAEEIKVLISELKDVKHEVEEKEPEAKVIAAPVVEETVVELNKVEDSEEPVAEVVVAGTEEHHAPDDYKIHEREIPVEKKSKKGIVVLIVLLILGLAAGGYYYFVNYTGGAVSKEKPSEKITPKEELVPVETKDDANLSDTVVAPVQAEVAPAAVKPEPEVKQQPAVETKKDEPKKEDNSIFEQPRVYKTFIGKAKIAKGSTLTVIAEKNYGHRNFWVYIYEANKAKIKNPNTLPAGFVVKLPKLDPKLTDENNPACIEYTRLLEQKYVNAFKKH